MKKIDLLHGDCLELMKEIPKKSIDLILTDPPYGTTACKWDSVIPFEPMWGELERIIKDTGAIIMTASQPFTSALVMSNPKLFKYSMVWDKVNLSTGALLANKRPMKRHEDICIFYKKQPTYNKQMTEGEPYKMPRNVIGVGEYADNKIKRTPTVNSGSRNPISIISIKGGNKSEKGFHPTQKPVELMEYLIKTYTNEGDTVLDFTMGPGSTGVACLNTNRNFIGIELDDEYFEIAKQRISEAQNTPEQITMKEIFR